MNMSDDDTNHQFDDQVNELLAQTLEGESLEDLFEQRKQQKKNHQDKQQKTCA